MREYLQNLDTHTIYTFIVSAVFGLSIFIEIVPIKINPWSKLFTWIGSKLFKKVYDKIEAVSGKVNEVSENVDLNEVDRIRWEVLAFANSCRRGKKHSKEEFEHVLKLNEKYCALIKKLNRVNGVYEEEFKYILTVYRKRLENNDFL